MFARLQITRDKPLRSNGFLNGNFHLPDGTTLVTMQTIFRQSLDGAFLL